MFADINPSVGSKKAEQVKAGVQVLTAVLHCTSLETCRTDWYSIYVTRKSDVVLLFECVVAYEWSYCCMLLPGCLISNKLIITLLLTASIEVLTQLLQAVPCSCTSDLLQRCVLSKLFVSILFASFTPYIMLFICVAKASARHLLCTVTCLGS